MIDMHGWRYDRDMRSIYFVFASLTILLSACDDPEPADPVDCAQFLDEESCLAAGCAGMLQVFAVPDLDSCTPQYAESVCIAGGEEVGQRHTYFREIAGETRFARTAECDASLEFEGSQSPGEGWTECTGAADDPPGCACMCKGGDCPAQVELDTMNACEIDSICPDFDLNDDSGSQAALDAAACFFDALIAATPGHLRAHGNFGDPQIDINLWIDESGQVRSHYVGSDANCLNCCGTVQPSLDLCTPADAAALAECKDAYLSGSSHPCMEDRSLWFSSCAPTAPMCG